MLTLRVTLVREAVPKLFFRTIMEYHKFYSDRSTNKIKTSTNQTNELCTVVGKRSNTSSTHTSITENEGFVVDDDDDDDAGSFWCFSWGWLVECVNLWATYSTSIPCCGGVFFKVIIVGTLTLISCLCERSKEPAAPLSGINPVVSEPLPKCPKKLRNQVGKMRCGEAFRLSVRIFRVLKIGYMCKTLGSRPQG